MKDLYTYSKSPYVKNINKEVDSKFRKMLSDEIELSNQ